MVGIYGLWGVGIDLDHIPHYLWMLFPERYARFADVGGRFAHPALLRAPGILCIVLGAYAIGCVAWMVRAEVT